MIAAASTLALGACKRPPEREPAPAASTPTPTGGRTPVLFVGHGSPMNAIEDTAWSRGWRAMGEGLPTPRAILCVSAHWWVKGTWVTGNGAPETIHDFSGFPRELHEVKYPARGDAELARRVAAVAGQRAGTRDDWGLDHGAWSVLARLRPRADVPVLQLSLDRRESAEGHLAIGRALASLRDEGVLVVASGNVTHNLRHALGGGGERPAWATSFDADVARALEQRDASWLARALETDAGKSAHPTPDHYLPLLYAVGASAGDAPTFPITGFDLGSISMRAVRFG